MKSEFYKGSNIMSKCFIYRYVFNDKTIYVGKTRRDLKIRIMEHSKENKFKPYIGKCKIEYFDAGNRQNMDIYEKYLINKISPLLNVADKEGVKFDFSLPYIEWIPYDKYTTCKCELNNEELLIKSNKQKRNNIQRSITMCKKRIDKLEEEFDKLNALMNFLSYHSIEEFTVDNSGKVLFNHYFELPSYISCYHNGKTIKIAVYSQMSSKNEKTLTRKYVAHIYNLKIVFEHGYQYICRNYNDLVEKLISENIFLKEKELEKFKLVNNL